MNRKPRVVLCLCYILSICVMLSIIYLPDMISPKAHTLDFRGYVEDVDINWDSNSVLINAVFINSDAKAVIKASTKISYKYLDGRDFPINSLKKGDMIDLNYKGWWGMDNDGVMTAEAKWITVCPIN